MPKFSGAPLVPRWGRWLQAGANVTLASAIHAATVLTINLLGENLERIDI
jgi:hypothetical protein